MAKASETDEEVAVTSPPCRPQEPGSRSVMQTIAALTALIGYAWLVLSSIAAVLTAAYHQWTK